MSNEATIPGGFFILARKIIESEIMKKPPLYMKVWIYLLARAQHTGYKDLKRGQLKTSIPEIQEACSWYVGARKVKPTKREIQVILDWMRGKSEPVRKSVERSSNVTSNRPMIVTSKVTHGLLVNIENYRLYQDISNYERYTEKTTERYDETPLNRRAMLQYKQECNKNEQEKKEVNNSPAPDPWDPDFELTDAIHEIENLYIIRRGVGSVPSTLDYASMKSLLADGISLEDILEGIDHAFDTFKPKHSRDRIRSFSYCETVIRDLHAKKQAKLQAQQEEKYGYAKGNRHHGAGQKEDSASESITGGKVGWINKPKWIDEGFGS